MVLARTAILSGLILAFAPFGFAAALGWRQGQPAVSPTSLQVEQLPQRLVRVGVEVFGSKGMLAMALSRTAGPQRIKFNGVDTLLAAHRGDDTLARIEGEMHGDYYGLHRLTNESGVIFDIGSNVGDVAINAWMLHPGMQVVAIEPTPPTYFYLCLNMWLNSVPELHLDDLGKPGKGGVLALNRAANAGGRTVDMAWNRRQTQNAVSDGLYLETSAHWAKATVRGVDINAFIAEYGLAPVQLFKIDCEGCEFEVLPTMERLLADKQGGIRQFAAEIHQNKRPDHKNKQRLAQKASNRQIQDLDRILGARGCDTRKWSTMC